MIQNLTALDVATFICNLDDTILDKIMRQTIFSIFPNFDQPEIIVLTTCTTKN